MTTAHKPTFHPAIGTANPGGYRYHAPRQQFSVRDMAAHTQLKYRALGQSSEQEVAERDLKAELEEREAKHYEKINKERRRQGLLPYSTQEESIPKVPAAIADNPNVDLAQFDDSDESASEEDSDSDSDSDDEDEEAELMRELEKIKKEREEERQRKERELEEQAAKERTDAILRGNPLLNGGAAAIDAGSFTVKRRWDDDVVFKNQARDEPEKKKRFINDTIRSDFHKNFLKKYIH